MRGRCRGKVSKSCGKAAGNEKLSHFVWILIRLVTLSGLKPCFHHCEVFLVFSPQKVFRSTINLSFENYRVRTHTQEAEERRMSTKSECFQLCFVFFFVLSLVMASNGHSIWRKPGCHKVGHTRKVSIPDCVEFHITTNACRGFCESWSIPSGMETLRVNPFQLITSVGQCCNIMETEDVEVKVMCLDGTRELTFKSAKSCSCYHCKKD